MANSVCGLTVIKRFSYRGNANEEYSNHYQFSGATPADPAAWRTLFNALVAEERKLFASDVAVIGGYGYDRTPHKGDHALWSVDLRVSPDVPVAGTLSPGLSEKQAGDSAVWVRWGLDRFNEKGKRVYLRKYFHPAYARATDPDALTSEMRTPLQAFATKLMDGSFAGARTIVSPPDVKTGDHGGLVPVNSAVAQFVTTRTLKRRGKRPPTSAP